ncbi:MAG TPA: hypothetical protein VFB62_07465, partial [Polyangiaceae bacterium]|nr:hypothetical protein [Polyangiaceae bacterium]
MRIHRELLIAALGAVACGEPAKTPDEGAGAVTGDLVEEPAPTPAPAEPGAGTVDEGTASVASAKSLVHSIARAAQAAFERESVESGKKGPTKVVHALCTSATPVPADVPKGATYSPKDTDFAGEDP